MKLFLPLLLILFTCHAYSQDSTVTNQIACYDLDPQQAQTAPQSIPREICLEKIEIMAMSRTFAVVSPLQADLWNGLRLGLLDLNPEFGFRFSGYKALFRNSEYTQELNIEGISDLSDHINNRELHIVVIQKPLVKESKVENIIFQYFLK